MAGVRVYAIVPAAGQSRRMGSPKQLLPVAGSTMLESVVEAMLGGGVAGLCVVTSTSIAETLRLSEDGRLIVAINDDTSSEMLDSIRMGMKAVADRHELGETDGFAVCPGDMPGVTPNAVRAVVTTYRNQPNRIAIAAHAGTKGHPIVFPAALADEVAEIRSGGLRMLVERHPERVGLVECASAGVVEDINTPEDFRRAGGGDGS